VYSIRLSHLAAAAAAVALLACDSTSPKNKLTSDAIITADVAASSGDAIASSLEIMSANEGAGGLSTAAEAASPAFSYDRTRTCWDASNAVVANCTPLSSVRKIATHVVANGSRSGSSATEGGRTVTWSGAAHWVMNDTVVRNFNGATETSRVHTDITTGHDTLTFSSDNVSRFAASATVDSVKAVQFNLPRSQNPFPVSGSIVRVDTVHVTAESANRSEDRQVVRVVKVTFPPDAQGNVALQVNDKTCTLNLVTHTVANCH